MAVDDTQDDEGSYEFAEEPLPMPPVGAAPGGVTQGTPALGMCAVCQTPIAAEYYMLGTARVCPNCKATAGGGPGGFGRFLKATALGVLGGLVGAAIWFGVRRASGYEIGLVAILVGFLVGVGVLKGSGNRGGRGYQFLAIVLTYLAIGINYAPDVYSEVDKGFREGAGENATTQAAPVNDTVRIIVVSILTIPVSLATPVIMGFSHPISLLLAGIALWEAWKINRLKTRFVGPFNATTLPPPMPR